MRTSSRPPPCCSRWSLRILDNSKRKPAWVADRRAGRKMDFNEARRQRRPGLRAFSAFLLLVAAVTVVLPTPSRAQDVLRIAAIVNEDVISVYDLMNRVRLVILSTGLENSAEMQRRLAPQVLRSLIDERLQLQERSEEHTSELQSLMRISYAVFCLKKKQY